MDNYFNKKKITKLCLWSQNKSQWVVTVFYKWSEDEDDISEDLRFETKDNAESFINEFGFIKHEGI